MPLRPGSDQATISSNISELTHNGSRPRSHRQIVAIALSNADRSRADGGEIDRAIRLVGAHSIAPGLREAIYKAQPRASELSTDAGGMNRLPESQRRPPSSWSSDAKLEPLAVGGNVNPNKGGADLAKKAYRLAQAMAQEQEKASEVNDERLAGGGSPMIPAFERAEMIGLSRGNNHPPGFVGGTSPGRTDTINTNVPSGSYVLPSDIVSGLGQGNSQAGAAVIQKMLGTGPYGIPLKSMGHAGHGIPHPPAPFHEPTMQTPSAPSGFADGGGDKEAVPVKIAAGEFLIHPHHVRHIGGGDLDRGHALLDKFVLAVRKKSIEEQKKLPGPKQAHEV